MSRIIPERTPHRFITCRYMNSSNELNKYNLPTIACEYMYVNITLKKNFVFKTHTVPTDFCSVLHLSVRRYVLTCCSVPWFSANYTSIITHISCQRHPHQAIDHTDGLLIICLLYHPNDSSLKVNTNSLSLSSQGDYLEHQFYEHSWNSTDLIGISTKLENIYFVLMMERCE